MLYKVQAVQRRVVPAPDNLPPGTWASDCAQVRRLTDTPYFTDLGDAKAWCRHMADRPLTWVPIDTSADTGCMAWDTQGKFYIHCVNLTVNPAAGTGVYHDWKDGS